MCGACNVIRGRGCSLAKLYVGAVMVRAALPKAEVTQQPCVGLHMAMDTRVRRTAYTRTHARAHAW